MKFKGPLLVFVLAVTALIAAVRPRETTDPDKEAVLMRTVLDFMHAYHFQPQDINDDFSKKFYDLYLDRIDGGHRFLTQEDVKQLEPFKLLLDDQTQSGDLTFFNKSVDLITAGLQKTQGYYREILSKPFDFSKKESLEFDPDKRGFAANDSDLKDYWQKYCKYETLTRLEESLERQEKETASATKKSMAELEEEARKAVLKLFDDWYNRMIKLKRNDRFGAFMSAMTNIFDPHSDYLQPVEKDEFNLRFFGRYEGIGATLQNEGDYTKVADVFVGGPAWKAKELENGDLILKVAQGDKEPVDVVGMITNEVVTYIRGEKGTEVRLTIKKKDGTIKVISIIRDEIIMEESFAKSLIIDGADANEKIGYIYLPRFYEDFEKEDGRFCSKDVAIEIEKLTAEGINGIILDLRSNGGGGLNEAIKLSGLFIEKGPVVQVKSKERNPRVYTDRDTSVQYRGPLAVMVNQYSASASEILAGALQDYGRAVIVGTSPSTFGKGSVQRIYNLDQVVQGADQYKPFGDIRLTVQKFYRINGGSNQLKGIIPDVALPGNFDFIEWGEKEEEYPLSWSEIAPVPFEQKVFKITNMQDLKALSASRTKNSAVFKLLEENGKRVKEQREITAYSLNMEEYRAYQKKQEDLGKQFENVMDSTVNKGVVNPKVDLAKVNQEEKKKAINDDWIKTVSRDIYIQETINVLHDMITRKNLTSRQ